MINPLITRYGEESCWLNYNISETKEGKLTKIPYSPITGRKGSSTNPEDWSDVKTAFSKSEKIGIVFRPDKKLLGCDFDKCLSGKEIIHEEKEKIERFLREADSYTEISPSGTGLHVFFEIEDEGGLDLIANRHGNYECYTSGRYFTVTNKSFGAQKDIRVLKSGDAIVLLSLLGYPWGKEKIDTPEVIGVGVKELQETHQVVVDDSVLLEKIFNARNGEAIKSLYNGDLTAHRGDHSVADMALLSHLAFWTKKNPVQMERMWISSPLGRREKTQTRQDYRERSIAGAISRTKEVYKDREEVKLEKRVEASGETEETMIEFLYTFNSKKDMVFTQNTENMCRILREHAEFKGRFRYDSFTNKMEVKVGEKWRDLEDNDAIIVQTRISILYPAFFGKVGKDMIYDAIVTVSKECEIDSAADYIKSLKWDGTARVDNWLTNVYHVEESEYHKKVGANWLKGLVKRIIYPGCKFDYVLVLEGEQGTKKSTSLGILGGSWHVETTMSTDTKDFFMQFQGKAIIEFSEGETLNRTEVKRMKAIITTQSDKYRPAYGRVSVDFPRRCVFAMTTNQQEYLKDETGNRRWLPVACRGEADVEWLRENRDQLFAEAYERVINKNESTWEFPEEETLRMQSSRRVQDPNTDLVVDWYYNKLNEIQRRQGITVHQVWRDAISGGFNNKPLDKWGETSIANILKLEILLTKKRKMIDGIQATRWYRTEDLDRTDEEVEQDLIASPIQGDFGVF